MDLTKVLVISTHNLLIIMCFSFSYLISLLFTTFMIARVAALPMATSSPSGDAQAQQNLLDGVPPEVLRQGFRLIQTPSSAHDGQATTTPRSEILLFFILNLRHLFCRLERGVLRLAKALAEAKQKNRLKGATLLLERENWHVRDGLFWQIDKEGKTVEYGMIDEHLFLCVSKAGTHVISDSIYLNTLCSHSVYGYSCLPAWNDALRVCVPVGASVDLNEIKIVGTKLVRSSSMSSDPDLKPWNLKLWVLIDFLPRL